MSTHKVCSTCQEDKPAEDYTKDTRYKSGLRSQCKRCRIVAQWETRWTWHIKYTYGMSRKEYDDMYESQQGRCAICKMPETRFTGRVQLEVIQTVSPRLVVDHDHETGANRGLLCHKCNVGMGQLGDDIDRLQAAIEYLRKYK